MKRFIIPILSITLLESSLRFVRADDLICERDFSAYPNQVKNIENVTAKLQRSEMIKIADCKEGMTEIDKKIIDETQAKVKKLKASSENSAEFEFYASNIINNAYDLLSPAAKFSLTQSLIKNSMASSESKEYKRAFNEYMSAADFHTKSFGPGGTYATIGSFDAIFGKAYKLHQESWGTVNNKLRNLYQVIEKLHLPDDQLLDLTGKLSRFNENLNDRNHQMFEGSQKRLEAERNLVLQVGAATALTVMSMGAASGAVAGIGAASGTYAAAGISAGTSTAAYTLAMGQVKMMGTSMLSDGDFGCEYAIRAYEENPKIAKDALVNGIIAGVFVGVGGSFFANYQKIYKAQNLTSSLTKANTLLHALEGTIVLWDGGSAIVHYKKSNDLLAQSQRALANNELEKAAKLANESLAELKIVHEAGVNAGSGVADLITLKMSAIEMITKFSDEFGSRFTPVRDKIREKMKH